MCGNFGIAGNGIIQDDIKVFNDLGLASQARGLDSTGYYETNTRNSNYSSKYFADIVDYSYFQWKYRNSKEAKADYKQRILDSVMANVIIGHTRAATSGDLSVENAMPFNRETFVLAHNGGFRLNKYHAGFTGKSDSLLFAEDVEKTNLMHSLTEVGNNGAYSIVMYSKPSKKLYFIRNHERPLVVAFNQKRGVMYWASEYGMLRWILDRNNIDISIYEGKTWKGSAMTFTKPGILYEVDPEKIRPHSDCLVEKEVLFWTDGEKKKLYWNPDLVKAVEDSKKEESTTKKEKKVKGSPEVVTVEEQQIKQLAFLQPVPKNEKKEGTNVIPFDGGVVKEKRVTAPISLDKNVRSFSRKCVGCDRILSPLEQWKIQCEAVEGCYIASNDTYFCECLGTNTQSVKQ